MKNPRGRVIAVKQLEPTPRALVEVESAVSCARCEKGMGCGAGLLFGGAGSRQVEALIAAGLELREGDEVRIELAPKNLLTASLLVYGLPLSGAILGAVFAGLADASELLAALAAFGGLAAGLAAARIRLRAASCLRQFTPKVVEHLATGH